MSAEGDNIQHGLPAKGVMKSLSPEGCNVALDGPAPSADQRVLLKRQTGLRISGRVRWVVKGHIGIEFDEPLPGEDAAIRLTNFQARESVEIVSLA